MALDAQRAIEREPDWLDPFGAEITARKREDPGRPRRRRPARGAARSRGAPRSRLAEPVALCLEGSLLVRFAPTEVDSAFVSSAVAHAGTLQAGSPFEALVARVTSG
jgi:putative acyl-CoA dehydrogenase